MLEKISPIDPESNFAQDIGLCSFSEAPRSSKLGRSEINSLYAATGIRALRNPIPFKGLEKPLLNW